jgi:outer membrane receptor protein involved in Fe transport
MKISFRLFLVLLLVLFNFGVTVSAEENQNLSSRLYQLDEVTVTEEKIKAEETTPNMSVVLPELLLQGISSTIDSALVRQPGVDIQRLQEVGGALDDESIKIRGFGSRRILLTINGRTMNTSGTAGGYFIDWTTISLNNIEKIEIIKGISDPRYGNVLGGVINLVTKKPTDKPVFEFQGLSASFDTNTVGFYHAWKPSNFEYTISGGYSKSDGYLKNGDFEIKNMNLYAGYQLPWKGKITSDINYSWVKKGFIVSNRQSKDIDSPDYNKPIDRSYPASDGEIMYGGMGAYPEPGSWWKKEKVYLDLGYDQPFANSVLNLRYWKNHGDREAYNTKVSVNRVFHKKFFDDRSYGFDGSYKIMAGNHEVTAGFDYKKFKDDGDKNYPDDYRAAFRNKNYVNSNLFGLYLMDDYRINDTVTLTPGLRYISYEGNAGPAGQAEGIKDISMSGIAPTVKLAYTYAQKSMFYISIARALRMPTPPEHYWHYSPDAGVNTSNLPFHKEDGIMLQGGWKAEFPSKTRIEISPYYYSIKDYIHFDLINFVSYNIDKAKIYGLEAELAQQLGKGFSAFANYTFQKSKTKGDPFVSYFVAAQDRDFDEIPGLPKHKINAGFQFKGTKGEKVSLYGRYVSSQKIIYNNNKLYNTDMRVRTQDSFFTVDIEGSYPITKNLSLTAYIHNIADKFYQERFGFPAAERNFGFGIKGIF